MVVVHARLKVVELQPVIKPMSSLHHTCWMDSRCPTLTSDMRLATHSPYIRASSSLLSADVASSSTAANVSGSHHHSRACEARRVEEEPRKGQSLQLALRQHRVPGA